MRKNSGDYEIGMKKDKQRRLIAFPHGIGDVMFLTPTLRELLKTDEIGLALLERVVDDELMIPGIENYHTVMNPWHHAASYPEGMVGVVNEAQALGNVNGYDVVDIIPLETHQNGVRLNEHRIDIIAREMQVSLADRSLVPAVPNHDLEMSESLAAFEYIVHAHGGTKEKTLPGLDRILEMLGDAGPTLLLETHTGFNWEPVETPAGVTSTQEFEHFTLGHLQYVLERADLFVGIDSGPVHMADAVGVKALCVFTHTWLQQSAPVGPSVVAALPRVIEQCPKETLEELGDRLIRIDGSDFESAIIGSVQNML